MNKRDPCILEPRVPSSSSLLDPIYMKRRCPPPSNPRREEMVVFIISISGAENYM
jgi:hypothetical protein